MDLVVYAMERSETEEKIDDGGTSQLLWQHLSSQLIFFVLFQFASFPHMVLSLHQKVCLGYTNGYMYNFRPALQSAHHLIHDYLLCIGRYTCTTKVFELAD